MAQQQRQHGTKEMMQPLPDLPTCHLFDRVTNSHHRVEDQHRVAVEAAGEVPATGSPRIFKGCVGSLVSLFKDALRSVISCGAHVRLLSL